MVTLGVLLEDFLIVVVGPVLGVRGVVLEVTLGKAAAQGLSKRF